MAFSGDQLASMSSSLTVVTSSLSNSLILAAERERTGYFMYNGSSQTIFVKCGFNASSGSLSYKIASSGSYEDDRSRPYNGPISVIWEAAAVGSLFVTEFK